ncbi:MAG: hypothetical protein JW871_02955 [Endomicrobiales bacterium]|nr:hypothetical protein [Endomicrobiales bacterium]
MKAKILTILILCGLFINIFVPKVQMISETENSFLYVVGYKSAIQYCMYISFFTMKFINKVFIQDGSLPFSSNQTVPKKQRNSRKNSANDFCLNDSLTKIIQFKNMKNITLTSFLDSDVRVMNPGSIKHGCNLISSIQFWLNFHCLFMLALFFLLPRGAIDNYSILKNIKTLIPSSNFELGFLFADAEMQNAFCVSKGGKND